MQKYPPHSHAAIRFPCWCRVPNECGVLMVPVLQEVKEAKEPKSAKKEKKEPNADGVLPQPP